VQRRFLLWCLLILYGVFGSLGGLAATAGEEGTLRIALSAPVTSLDPHNYRSGIDWIVDSQLYDTLVYRDPNGDLKPALAKSWETIDDLTWRFHLREDVVFHDSTPFNADAVKINLERLINPEKPARASFYLTAVSSVEVVDEYTVDIRTKAPTPPLLNFLAQGSIGMISPTALAQYGDEITYHPVGTGPFKFVEWVPGQRVVLERNESYFRGAPKLARVVFLPIPEDASRVMALMAGDVDVIQFPPIEYIPILKNSPEYSVLNVPGHRVVGIWFNVEKYPFTDWQVRRALEYAIDRDAIVTQILGGVATKAMGVLPPGVWGRLEYWPYYYDPDKAKELLANAGWQDTDGDGVLDKEGEPFKVTLSTCMGKYYKDVEIATAVQAQLRKVGVDVKVQVWEWGAYLDHLQAHEQDFHIQGWGASADADEPLRSNFYSGKPWNVMGYSNSQVDELLDKGMHEMDLSKRRQYYEEAQRLIIDDAVWITLYNEPKIYAVRGYVKNFHIHPEDQLILLGTEVKR